MNEQIKYETIKNLVDSNGNKKRAALKLNLSTRQINRLITGYKKFGKAFFVHGNRGRKPANTISDLKKKEIVTLYNSKYYDANFAHFTELLRTFEGINVSESAVTAILENAHIYSPKLTKAKKKRIKKALLEMQEKATTVREKDLIQANLVAVEDAHSRRPRCTYFGELIQMDASPFRWFDNTVTSLHIAVDDATGMIVGAYFDKEETLNGYYHVFHQILTSYGIPYKFFTDNRSVFNYERKKSPSSDEDTHTQFAYACHQLGIELETSSVPQAKARVERMFQTLQSRLRTELRLAGVINLKTANEFLNSYIKEFTAKFALPVNHYNSVFVAQPSEEKINLTLAILTQRTVDAGHCIKFRNKYYRFLDEEGIQVHYAKGTKVMVIQSYDGNLFCSVNNRYLYALDEIPIRAEKSKDLDFDYQPEPPKKRPIPAMNHPWRQDNFAAFLKKQKHIRKQEVANYTY